MGQEGGKRSSTPKSIFEIDEFDSNWEGAEPSGVELMREPSLMPEADSEVQAASPRTTSEGSGEEHFPAFEDGLPLIRPDGDVSANEHEPEPAELAHAVRRTGNVEFAENTRRTGNVENTRRTGNVENTRRTGNVENTRRTGPTDPAVRFARSSDQESERTTSPGDPLLTEVRDRYAMGDYSGALVIAEGILANDANNTQARRYADNCRQVLEQMYCAKLGPLNQRPEVGVSADQMRWLSLDHRAGFLLSLIDGSSTVEELLDISGMPRFEALRTLCDLLEQNVITLAR